MGTNLSSYFPLIAVLFLNHVHAQEVPVDEILIEAPRMSRGGQEGDGLTEYGPSVRVIDRKTIQRKNLSELPNLLKEESDLQLQQTGGTGGQASIFMRGAKAEHTKVLIDGIPSNDPIDPGGSFNFGPLSTHDLERIEVIRGPQSVAYGSDSMGGVIHLITKEGRGKPGGEASLEIDSSMGFRGSGSASGKVRNLSYSLNASRVDTEGFSAAEEADGNNERDAFRSTQFSTKLKYSPIRDLTTTGVYRLNHSFSELDQFGGPGGDDPNASLETRQYLGRFEIAGDPIRDFWKLRAGYSMQDLTRINEDRPDTQHLWERSDQFRAISQNVDFQSSFSFGEHSLLLGADSTFEEGSSETLFEKLDAKQTQRLGLFGQIQIRPLKPWSLAMGGRIDQLDLDREVGSERTNTETLRSSTFVEVPRTGTELSSSVGTAYKAPTIYQLHSSFGNPALKPETSWGWDIGVRQRTVIGKTEVTYFRNHYNDLIEYVGGFNGTFQNTGNFVSPGVELRQVSEIASNLNVSASHTVLTQPLIRRPRNKTALDATYAFRKQRLDWSGGFLFVGAREDRNFVLDEKTTLAPYAVFHTYANWSLNPTTDLSARIDNLFNRQYQDIWGFSTPGITGRLGVRVRL